MLKRFIIGIIATFTVVTLGISYSQAREIVEVPHWQKSTITVYIPEDGDKKATSALKTAFGKWQGVSCGHIKFKYTDDEKKPSDIKVSFSDSAAGDSPITTASYKANGNTITEGEITIASESKDFKKYSNKYISNVMVHEVGKVLGMPVNTTKKSSIMYVPISENQSLMKVDERKFFSISEWSFSKRNLKE